ncbi:MAG TPA: hypothetical protein VKB85_15135, partial [Propionibacteriaceae bacterium]|nr:hypothetical protein [Propionibacteriaceae bacterium]
AVPARLRPGASQIARLTAAAVFSYFVANAYSPGILDLTAPLTGERSQVHALTAAARDSYIGCRIFRCHVTAHR